MKVKSNKTQILALFLFLGLCYFPIFLHLDYLPLKQFDESRLANSAIEMFEGGNLIVVNYDSQPDMWSTKPPLMIWMQAICLQIFGYGELAIRFPSAIAALLTVFLLVYFFYKKKQKPLIGFIAGLVLITSPGYIAEHVSRSGDYDALLTLFNTAYILYFYLFLEAENKKEQNRYIWLTALFVTLATLTKGVAGLICTPPLLLFLLLSKKNRSIIFSKTIWIPAMMVIAIIGCYYLGREFLNPGYIFAVIDNELTGRYNTIIEEHNNPWNFYFLRLFQDQFSYWIYFLPLGIFAVFQQKKESIFVLFKMIMACSLFYLFIITLSKTKLPWYTAPLFPFLSIIVAFGIEFIILALQKITHQRKALILGLCMFSLFGFPYSSIIDKVYHSKEFGDEMDQYTRLIRQTPDIDRWTIATYWFRSNLIFYQRMYKAKNIELKIKKPDWLKQGDHVILCEEDTMEFILENYEFKVVDTWQKCTKLVILKKVL